MNKEQLRNEAWSATYNAAFFARQKSAFSIIDWLFRVLLVLAVIVGVVPFLAGHADKVWASWVSMIAGVFGIAGLPLLGIGDAITRSNEWRIRWIEIRDGFVDACRVADATDTVPLDKVRKLKKMDQEIEKDSRQLFHVPFQTGAVLKKATKTFELYEI